MTTKSGGGRAHLVRWVGLNATVFVAAGCIMIVEILSTRLVARYLGSSLYTWTSAIGVVLAGISVGNYIGGRLADRFPSRPTLAIAFVASSFTCWLIPMLNSSLGDWELLMGLAWPTRIFWHFALAFLLPATVLGTISPVVAKVALEMGLGPGRTVGTIYAWGTVGSIVGTFVAGFWLVAWLGTDSAVLVVSGILALMALVFGASWWLPRVWMGTYTTAMVLVIGPWAWTEPLERLLGLRDSQDDITVFLEDSHYQRVRVLDTGGNRRAILLDYLIHGHVDLGDPLRLLYEYEAIFAEAVDRWEPTKDPVSALFIGGGGYVFPRYLELIRPGSLIQVSEIDPVVTRAAYEAFGLPQSTSVESYDLDARNHVTDLIQRKRSGKDVPTFDLVFGDAFSDLSVPFHLVTLEFYQMLAELMADDGMYLMNVVDNLESGAMLCATVNTVRQVFPHTSVFAADAGASGQNTFVIVGARRPVDLDDLVGTVRTRHGFNSLRLDGDILDGMFERWGELTLTDDFAPVETLLAPVVHLRRDARETGGSNANELAVMFADGDIDGMVRRGRELIDENPRRVGVRTWIARGLRRLGRPEEAVDELRSELRLAPGNRDALLLLAGTLAALGDDPGALEVLDEAARLHASDGEVRALHARSLSLNGDLPGAVREYRAALELRPGYVDGHLALTRVLLERNDAEGALLAAERAFELAPERAGARFELGRCLQRSGRAAEALIHHEAAVEGAPERAEYWNELARCRAENNDPTGAAEAFRQAVALDPDAQGIRRNLGLALERSGETDEAIEVYREALRRNPGNPPLVNRLARLLATASDDPDAPGEALLLAQRLLDNMQAPEPEVLDTFAIALARAGRYEEAVAAAERALDLAEARGRPALARGIRERLRLYQAGRPYRSGG